MVNVGLMGMESRSVGRGPNALSYGKIGSVHAQKE